MILDNKIFEKLKKPNELEVFRDIGQEDPATHAASTSSSGLSSPPEDSTEESPKGTMTNTTTQRPSSFTDISPSLLERTTLSPATINELGRDNLSDELETENSLEELESLLNNRVTEILLNKRVTVIFLKKRTKEIATHILDKKICRKRGSAQLLFILEITEKLLAYKIERRRQRKLRTDHLDVEWNKVKENQTYLIGCLEEQSVRHQEILECMTETNISIPSDNLSSECTTTTSSSWSLFDAMAILAPRVLVVVLLLLLIIVR